MDDLINKAAGAAGLAGGALMFSPLGFPFLFHGVSGALVGGATLYAANAVMGKIVEENRRESGPSDEKAASEPYSNEGTQAE
ncbi:hypothetical protein CHL67_04430 [Prosthecochloris sp. GSB1]|uniref:hypothetical protein n=1 Tax=Prosthecochloris sp. GSB1 TaxID=281093 RepID=UPI000B8CE60F|nr:hypothetical protein [Prosthecochloris sp. GSB1]ASQ90268.1 hypothetical protein CHL67_04430 [Prosthecochloris sp. GSB1]